MLKHFFFLYIQQLCSNQAVLVHNVLLCTIGKNSEGWCSWVLDHKHFY